MNTNTIFIAKTQRLICEALCQYCASLGLEVIGSTDDSDEARYVLERAQPDFAIIEAQSPTFDGIKLIKRLRENEDNKTQIILYVNANHPIQTQELKALDVNLTIYAEDGIEKLTKILLRQKQVPVPSLQTATIDAPTVAKPQTAEDYLDTLTPAQLRILSLVGAHKTMPEIARKLYISPHTVNNHIANIRRKLDLRGRGVVLKYALTIKHRLVETDGKIIISDYYSSLSNA